MTEMINDISATVCKNLRDSSEALDPRDIFMNATLNVVSGFAFGTIYDFKDPEFIRLIKHVKTFFDCLAEYFMSRIVTELTPMVLLRQKWYRNLRHTGAEFKIVKARKWENLNCPKSKSVISKMDTFYQKSIFLEKTEIFIKNKILIKKNSLKTKFS